MRYDVIIIGAGPGGIFSAYELTRANKNLKVAVFESGHELAKRKCPIDGEKVKSCMISAMTSPSATPSAISNVPCAKRDNLPPVGPYMVSTGIRRV